MTQNRIETFKKMLLSNPENQVIRYGLANEYWKVEDFEAVVENLELYLKATDDQGAGYRLLGQAYQKLGKISEARKVFLAGQNAANNHGHPGMSSEIKELIEELDEID